MKAIEKSVTNGDVSEAMDELRESISKLLNTIMRAAKNIDWEGMAPKLIMGLIVIYGLRNRKLLSPIISSVIIGMITKRVSAKLNQE